MDIIQVNFDQCEICNAERERAQLKAENAELKARLHKALNTAIRLADIAKVSIDCYEKEQKENKRLRYAIEDQLLVFYGR